MLLSFMAQEECASQPAIDGMDIFSTTRERVSTICTQWDDNEVVRFEGDFYLLGRGYGCVVLDLQIDGSMERYRQDMHLISSV